MTPPRTVISLIIISVLVLSMASAQPTGCSCYNPLSGTNQAFFGEPEFSCEHNFQCFVPCQATCQDKIFNKGFFDGKCSSVGACSAESPDPPGYKICACKNPGERCEGCEVACDSDCHDISRRGGACYSRLACEKDLLFEARSANQP